MAVSEELRRAIIERLQQGPCRPTDLLKAMLDQHFIESDIREAVSLLLNENKIELTGQQELQNHMAAA